MSANPVPDEPEGGGRLKIRALLARAKGIVLFMLAVYLLSFGAGYVAGRFKLVSPAKVRASALFELNRNLETKVPGYGTVLLKYKAWERRQMIGSLQRGRAVRTMFIIFLNNWIAADLTMIVRAAFLAPMVLYPLGRFVQGLTLSQSPSGYRIWMTWLTEFGGYFLSICGMLTIVLWTLFFRRFRFPSRRRAFTGGLRVFAVYYGISALFFFIGAYLEMMFLLGSSFR